MAVTPHTSFPRSGLLRPFFSDKPRPSRASGIRSRFVWVLGLPYGSRLELIGLAIGRWCLPPQGTVGAAGNFDRRLGHHTEADPMSTADRPRRGLTRPDRIERLQQRSHRIRTECRRFARPACHLNTQPYRPALTRARYRMQPLHTFLCLPQWLARSASWSHCDRDHGRATVASVRRTPAILRGGSGAAAAARHRELAGQQIGAFLRVSVLGLPIDGLCFPWASHPFRKDSRR
jgi:hypothetical protein